MKQRRLVNAIYGWGGPFDHLFVDSIGTSDPDELTREDTLVVWGGEDISPALYNRKVSQWTGANAWLSQRDRIESYMMDKAINLGIPIIGVCRGAQMLCAKAGGYLIQHVNNHCDSHKVVTDLGEKLKVNSLHHQMMVVDKTEHDMIAWCPTPLSDVYYDEDNTVDIKIEPELVFFNQIKGMAVQWHPEMMDDHHATNQWFFNKLKEYSVC